ncbi:Hypothetical predicted protein [Mytilus galloprovincialis]|uniref:B box-type domain-containing protein n=1 Tax=Mytilus galloprovincialis TaxID=29158 RepID=A0A8B6EN97_MYTGA|nr:Hypothetical predicted protein [Mytilus galloprovincialis]
MAQIAAQKCEFSCDKVAVLYCKGCGQFLCIECRQNVHDKVRQFKDHEVVDIHKEGNRVRPNPVCETHNNQFLYYCSKCECLTCAECMTSSHNEHKTEKIKIVADARRQNVNQIIEQLKTKVETVKKKLETIDTEHSIQIKSDCESYVKTVEDTVNDLHTIVDRHKLIPMTTASDFKIIENEDLGRKRAFFRSRHDETADRLLKFENLLLEKHDSFFLTEWKALQTDVKMNDEETDDPLAAPRRLDSFNQKKLTKSVIDEIDEKFQMKLQEHENKLIKLEKDKIKLKEAIKVKEDEIGKLSKLSIELKEMKIQVSELGNKNEKLNTEIKERKEQEFLRLQEHENKLNKLEKDKTKLKEAIKVKEDEIEKISKLLQGLNVKEKMIKGLQEENSKLTTECKQREIKAFSQ